MTPEERLKERGLEIPPAREPAGNYVPCVRTGNLIFLSGHGPTRSGSRPAWRGKVGSDLSVEEGYAAAQSVALYLLAALKQEIGELSRVRRVVKLLGMVDSAPGFHEQPKVINGASDLFVDVFGEKGRHARSAVGMAGLPFGIPVEIEMIVEVE
jgi:enamine deaminase RidA (YjgF/YER057c/UK114 family)